MGLGAALLAAIEEDEVLAGSAVEVSVEHADRPTTATAARPAIEIALR
jgi:hypothetical protein